MNEHPTRRIMLSAVTASLVRAAVATPAQAEGPSLRLAELGAELTTESGRRKSATIAFRAARRRVARWGETLPRPDYSGDGRALLTWLEAYRAAIEESGASGRHATYQRACAEHEHLARTVVAGMLDDDCDGIVRRAMLAGLAGATGRAGRWLT